MKLLNKSAKSKLGRVLVSTFLLVAVLTTKAVHNNNVQVVQALTSKSQSTITTQNTQQNITKPQYINRECHIIPTLPQVKQNQYVAFMRCTQVIYNNSTQQYTVQLQDQNSKLFTYSICKSQLNKSFLQDVNELFYNQILIATVENNTNTIQEFSLLDEAITGEQLSPDSINDEINRLIYKNNVKDQTDMELWK